jgi:hypothetical protein
MPLCVQCARWATANRIMCDFLHRGVAAPTPCERAEDLELPVSP